MIAGAGAAVVHLRPGIQLAVGTAAPREGAGEGGVGSTHGVTITTEDRKCTHTHQNGHVRADYTPYERGMMHEVYAVL